MKKKRIKELIAKNQMNLTLAVISLVAFIIGCFGVGFLKSFIIVGVIDILLSLPTIIDLYQRKKKGGTNMAKKKTTTNHTTTRKKKITPTSKKVTKKDILEEKTVPLSNKPIVAPTKKKKQKKKGKLKRFLKWFLIGCFIIGTIILIIAGIFLFQVIKDAPEFDPNRLDRQESTILYFDNGEIITKIGAQKREKITYDQMPEVLVNAIVATEDSRYFKHNGFDLPRFLKASIKQVLGKGGGGASTITMQVSKNNYTSRKSEGIEGIKRKFTDIYMAMFKIEKKYTKEQILEFYVNDNYMGGGAYGVEQACLTYFGKHAKDINLAEAAMIAGLFQSPGAYDPFVNPEACEKRRKQVLYLMERHGYIDAKEREAAGKMTVETLLNTENTTTSDSGNEYMGFINTVVAEIKDDFNIDPYTTPLKIYTTLKKEKQDEINKILTGETYKWKNPAIDAGIAMIDTKTGALLAVSAGRHKMYDANVLNYATIEHQIGSTAKPLFDYGPGIEYNNWGTGQLFFDEEHGYSNGGNVNNWDGKYMGMMTMRQALRMSRNIPAIKAFQALNNKDIKTFTSNLHLTPELEGNIIHEAHAIGGYSGESPVGLAAAYNAFANGGYYITPHSYTKIEYRDTGEVVEKKIEKTKAMSEETAYMVMSMLIDTPSYALGPFAPIAGVTYGAKTGTTNFDSATFSKWNLPVGAVNDFWVVGSSPDYTISLWYGYDSLKKENIQSGYINKVGDYEHQRLFQILGKALFDSGTTFTKPENVIEVQIEKDTYPIMLPSENTPSDQIITELFKKGTEPTDVSPRFKTLDNITNLKGTSEGSKVTLSWKGIATPWAIDTAIQTKNYQPIFSNNGNLQNYVGGRIGYFGNLQYTIFKKNSDGSLTQINTTTSETITFTATTSGDTTYVVKAGYTNFGGCMSSGTEVVVNSKSGDSNNENNDKDNENGDDNKDNDNNNNDSNQNGKVTVSYVSDGPIKVSKKNPLNSDGRNYIKVIETINGKNVDVTFTGDLSVTVNDNINYDIPGTYTATFRVTYKGKKYNLTSKQIIVE